MECSLNAKTLCFCEKERGYCNSYFPLKPNTLVVPGPCWRQRNNRKPPEFQSLALGPLSNPFRAKGRVSLRGKFKMIISFGDSLNWNLLVQREYLVGQPCALHSPVVLEWCPHMIKLEWPEAPTQAEEWLASFPPDVPYSHWFIFVFNWIAFLPPSFSSLTAYTSKRIHNILNYLVLAFLVFGVIQWLTDPTPCRSSSSHPPLFSVACPSILRVGTALQSKTPLILSTWFLQGPKLTRFTLRACTGLSVIWLC